MKINYFELKLVDSGTNLPELKRSPKRQTLAVSNIYQEGVQLHSSSRVDVFLTGPSCSVCMWRQCRLVNRKQMGPGLVVLREDRQKKRKN